MRKMRKTDCLLAIFLIASVTVISCNQGKKESAITSSKSNGTIRKGESIINTDKAVFISTAKDVITVFNETAETIKTEAYKNQVGLNTEVKQRLIELEQKVEYLETKLESVPFQNNETWGNFQEEINHEIDEIKKGVRMLSTGIAG